ncbi:hypothetical protein [Kitasatospora sp. NPDC056184]|uniref:hypothetical protein n=1 Tax=Kitasatospora sp. NPDC056184 TaxID=3345738 RepID=UPI0035DA64CF
MSTYPPWAAGQRITAAGLRAGLPDWVSKSADEIVTSSSTLQLDDHLTLPVEAGATYTVHSQLFVSAGDSAADIKIGWSFPAGGTLHFGGTGAHTGALTGSTSGDAEFFGIRNAQPNGGGGTSLAFGISSGLNTWIRLEAILITTAAGALTLMWAQNSPSGTATRVMSGSWLELRRRA